MDRYKFTDLYSAEYEHPFDKKALDRLENTRGIQLLTRKVLEAGLEKYHLIKHTGDNIRINPSNIPEVVHVLEEACSILQISPVPELYINLDDKIKSLTSGQSRHVIVISSGAVELLNEDELLFLLGRELGHIKSNHVLYHMMADSLQVITQMIGEMSLGIGNLLSMPIRMALLHWHRMSEFTADRAGLLVCQDIEVAARTFIKIAGLPLQYHDRVTVEDFRQQAHEFDDVKSDTLDKLIRFAAAYDNYQPFTVIRGSQLFKWFDDGEFQNVMDRDSFRELSTGDIDPFTCKKCGFQLAADEYFCRMCGEPVQRSSISD